MLMLCQPELCLQPDCLPVLGVGWHVNRGENDLLCLEKDQELRGCKCVFIVMDERNRDFILAPECGGS